MIQKYPFFCRKFFKTRLFLQTTILWRIKISIKIGTKLENS